MGGWHEHKRIVNGFACARADGASEYIYRHIVHIEEQNQPISGANAIDGVALKNVLVQVDGTMGIQIAAQFRQVKGCLVNAPVVGSPLGNVVHHIQAKHLVVIADRNNVQLIWHDGLHVHAVASQIMIAVDVVTQAMCINSHLAMV